VLDDEERPLLWGRLRECLPMMLESSPDTTIFKITALGEQFGRLLRALEAMLERRELPLVALVRSAGVVYLAVPMLRPGVEGRDALREVAAQVIEHAAMLAEHVTIPWCPLALKRRIPVWGPPRSDFALMEKMKQVFDPHRILNPGRYVGGL
jgi:FAD/FMN-containing dehydrogenase